MVVYSTEMMLLNITKQNIFSNSILNYEVSLHRSDKFWQNLRIIYCLTYAINSKKEKNIDKYLSHYKIFYLRQVI